MKPFEKLTDAEVNALDSETIERYIDLECAEQGVPFVPPVPVRPAKVNESQPDTTLHLVGGIAFGLLEDAERIAGEIAKCDRWETKYENYAGQYRSLYKPTFEPVIVTTQRVVTAAAVLSLGVSEAKATEAREAFQRASEEFNDISGRRAAIAVEIHQRVGVARTNEMTRANYQRAHTKYLDLAGGRRDVAARFFENAYPDARTILPEAFEDLFATMPAVPVPTTREYEEGDSL